VSPCNAIALRCCERNRSGGMVGVSRLCIQAALLRCAFLVAVLAMLSGPSLAQDAHTEAVLPDAPSAKLDQDQSEWPQRVQSTPFKTTILVLGRRSVFFPELAFNRGPLSTRKKLELAVDETIAPSRVLGSAFTAGVGQARDALPGYGQEWGGYGKRFSSSMASNASSHLFGTFLLPSMLHQDPRYFVKLYGTPAQRVAYAIRRVVVTRTDTGDEVPNWSGTLGGLMAEALANSYLPSDERTADKTFSRFGIRIGFGIVNNVVREYWPTIFKSLRVSKIVPSVGSDPGTVRPPVGPPSPPKS
jgi:hypothetical protein